MPDKPAVPTYLKRGGAIGNFRGFADTWNWMVSCWERLRAGDNCRIGGVSRGWPVVRCTLPPGLGGGGGTSAPQRWYNAAEITTGAAGGPNAGNQVVNVSRVRAFSGALLVQGADTELPLVEGMTVYLHVVLTVSTGGTLSGTVTVTDSARSTTPYTGDDYYIPIWHVDGGKLYDATIPGMTKRI